MAPVTPSPFRFAGPGTGAHRRRRSPDRPESTQTVNKNITSKRDQPDLHPDTTPVTASQFAPTPRFSASRPAQQAESSRLGSTYKSSFAQALQGPRRSLEDVEEVRRSQDGDEMLDDDHLAILPAARETADQDLASSGSVISDLPYSPKRRRLEDSIAPDLDQMSTQASAKPEFPHPAEPAIHMAQKPLQFTHAANTMGSVVDVPSALRRPVFLRPSGAPPDAGEQPLPEMFSPHHRGQRFVPGGMAATVQQWVIETGQAAVQSRRRHGSSAGEDYVLQMHVREVKGNGPFVVRGLLANGKAACMLLTSESNTAAYINQEVKTDTIVVVRAPIVDVKLDGDTLSIGVDWRILP